MSDWDKGVLRVNEDNVLGNPLLGVPEPRLRETGILTVEQLRAFEIRLHKYIGMQVAESAKLLTDRIRAADSQSELRDERIAREAAERGLDLTVRLHAVDQRAFDRTENTDALMVEGFARSDRQFTDVRIEFGKQLESVRHRILSRMELSSEAHEFRYQELVEHLHRFRLEVESRTALGRLRRFKAWIVLLARRVRYGR